MSNSMRAYEVHSTTQAFRRHVDTARRILDESLAKGRMLVSSSWGKDSVAMCGLVVEHVGTTDILHLASPYSLPGYDETVEHFSKVARVHTVQAARSLTEYIELCRDVGLPHERTASDQNRVVGSIKRTPGAKFAEEHGFDVVALGMRIEEKGQRAKVLRYRGPIYQLASGMWRSNPIAYWKPMDVWAFIVSRDLPYNRRIYDSETHDQTRETIRNTGWLSTDGAERGRIAWLREHFPEQYEALRTSFPQVEFLT